MSLTSSKPSGFHGHFRPVAIWEVPVSADAASATEPVGGPSVKFDDRSERSQEEALAQGVRQWCAVHYASRPLPGSFVADVDGYRLECVVGKIGKKPLVHVNKITPLGGVPVTSAMIAS